MHEFDTRSNVVFNVETTAVAAIVIRLKRALQLYWFQLTKEERKKRNKKKEKLIRNIHIENVTEREYNELNLLIAFCAI